MEIKTTEIGNEPRETSTRKLYAFRLAVFLLCISIIGLEFSFNLAKQSLWRDIAIVLDLILVAGFIIHVIHEAFKARHTLKSWFIKEKLDVATVIVALACISNPRLAGGIIIGRLLASLCSEFLESDAGKNLLVQLNLMPSQTLALSFLGTIAVGTVLLMFPAATKAGHSVPFLDALFTITSATCVVGLSVIHIGEYFSSFGQTIILLAIQVGGFGIMVLSAAFAVLVGGHIPSKRQVGLREVLDISTPGGLRKLMVAVTTATFVTEFVGALLLFVLWSDDIPNLQERLWWAIFHSVSAFCNAGFSLAPNSLLRWVNDPLVCWVFMVLITMGSMGFFVISDLTDPENRTILKPAAIWNRLHTQTKVVLLVTVVLNSLGMLLFLYLEYDGLLKGLSIGSKINAALFHAISLRSAGFSTVSIGHMAAPTIIVCIVWMFIGAASGSTGGGIKITTATVSLMTVWAMLRGRQEVELFHRRLPPILVNRSLSILLISGMIVMVFLTLLTATQDITFEKLFFEVVSAFGTAGFTLDTTTRLDAAGRIFIIMVMFVGRIGPLTLALAVGERRQHQGYRYPEGRIAVG